MYFIYECHEMYGVFQTLTPEARDPFAILSKPRARTQSAKPEDKNCGYLKHSVMINDIMY